MHRKDQYKAQTMIGGAASDLIKVLAKRSGHTIPAFTRFLLLYGCEKMKDYPGDVLCEIIDAFEADGRPVRRPDKIKPTVKTKFNQQDGKSGSHYPHIKDPSDPSTPIPI